MSVLATHRRIEHCIKCVTGDGGSSSGLIGAASIWVDHSRTWHYVGKANLFWALWVCRENRNYPAFIVRPDLQRYCTACPLCRREWEADEMPPEEGNGKAGKGQGRGGGHDGAQWQRQGGQGRDHRYQPYGVPYMPLPMALATPPVSQQATEQNTENENHLQLPNETCLAAWPPQSPEADECSSEESEESFQRRVHERAEEAIEAILKQRKELSLVPQQLQQREEEWFQEQAEEAIAWAAANSIPLNERKEDQEEAKEADSAKAGSSAIAAGVQRSDLKKIDIHDTLSTSSGTSGGHCCSWML